MTPDTEKWIEERARRLQVAYHLHGYSLVGIESALREAVERTDEKWRKDFWENEALGRDLRLKNIESAYERGKAAGLREGVRACVGIAKADERIFPHSGTVTQNNIITEIRRRFPEVFEEPKP